MVETSATPLTGGSVQRARTAVTEAVAAASDPGAASPWRAAAPVPRPAGSDAASRASGSTG
ncbi:DUF5914 domain-containing protein [Streptomyces sp.]|uniref:DUF5914 domain-containing protein n=1 Tax=Streptomyces sp. TaxID=1931 RepID=UPI0028123695|nr:DUF5914 domain-containing protein [Streptomyces sp.]